MIHQHQHFDLLGKIILERVVFTPPLRLLEKLNDEACLLYSISGNSTLYGVDKKFSLKPASSVLMKCGNYFNHWIPTKGNTKNEVLAIHFYPDVIRYVYGDDVPHFLISKSNNRPVSFHAIQHNALLKPYIDSLLFYFENPKLVDEPLVILKVKELLNLLYKLDSNNIRELMHDLFNPLDVDFKQTIHANIYENLSMEELAHLTKLSLSTFKRKFREIFSDSPASYIKKKRLEKATELLQVSSGRIVDICFDCGFNNLDNFSKSFKKTYGLTPTEFRNKF